MKYTLCITQHCNLACTYCYIGKKNVRMSLPLAEKIVDFIFNNTPAGEKIDLGFFGGEPLIEFELVKAITKMVEGHPAFNKEQVEMTVVTNGTIFSKDIAEFLASHGIGLCISCDGPPAIQDMSRRFSNGSKSAAVVEKNLEAAVNTLPSVLVNAVYHPKTLQYLPQVVEYFFGLGLRHIYLNPDFSAPWSRKEADQLSEIYGEVARQYTNYYISQNPLFISLIDSKIIVILRGGYDTHERCKMGKGEFAFTPTGNVYPCERLIADDSGDHCIGNIHDGLNRAGMSCKMAPGRDNNDECFSCGLKAYCMNWCGCSNYFSTGYYNRVGPFLCASEKAAIKTAFDAYQVLEQKLGPVFIDHLTGMPAISQRKAKKEVK